jgi:predicted permease
MRVAGVIQRLRQDVTYAVRSARRAPLLSCIVVVALSLGMGLNAGVFTVLDALFLQPPVQRDPGSFVQLYPRYEGWFTGAEQDSLFTAGDYDALRKESHTLSQVAASEPIGVTLDDVHQSISANLVSCNYFSVFGISRPRLGRLFLPGECKPGTSARIAVLSEHVWKNDYDSDPRIVGRSIMIGGHPVTVIGVAPEASAAFLAGGVWLPYSLQPVFGEGTNLFRSPDVPWLSVTGRLRDGYSRAEAKAELETILQQQDRLYVERKISALDRKTQIILTDGSFIENPSVHTTVTALMALMMGPLLLVLLLACTNVTMLFLSRSVARRAEIATRLALGISRGRLARMLAFESFLTAALAGVLSIFLAYRIPGLIENAADPGERKFAHIVHPDWRVFAFLAALVLAATVLSSLAPMRTAFRLDLVGSLKGGVTAVTVRSRTTGALIIAQIAMSFVLLAAAFLFARMPDAITDIDPGFNTRQVMQVPLEIPTPPYTAGPALALQQSADARIRQLPAVQSLAYANLEPFRQAPPSKIRTPMQTPNEGRPASVDDVSPGFFSTFGISVLRGRFFADTDVSATASAAVAIVSTAFARDFWGDQDPLGKIVVTEQGRRLVVVGVAADTRSERFGILDGPRLYTVRSPESLDGQLFVRFNGPGAPVAASIRNVLKQMNIGSAENPETILVKT